MIKVGMKVLLALVCMIGLVACDDSSKQQPRKTELRQVQPALKLAPGNGAVMVYDFKLEDGTRCVAIKGGNIEGNGITCDFKSTPQQ